MIRKKACFADFAVEAVLSLSQIDTSIDRPIIGMRVMQEA